jgi:hypothetical protein
MQLWTVWSKRCCSIKRCRELANLSICECGNVGRRALRSGAPAVTPSVSAQAGNARPRFQHYRIYKLTNWLIGSGFFYHRQIYPQHSAHHQ